MIKKRTFFKIKAGILYAAIFLTIAYAVSSQWLKMMDIYYRTWVIVLGDIVSFIVLPLSILSFFLKGKLWKRILGMAISLVVFLVLFSGIRMPHWEKESFIQENVIESEVFADLGSTCYHEYYSCYSPFVKRKYQEISNIVKLKAEEKYGEEFVVSEKDLRREKTEKVSIYTLYSASDPTLEMHMFGLNVFYEFMDDYGQARVNHKLEQCTELLLYLEMREDETQTTFQIYDKSIPNVMAPVIAVQEPEKFQAVSELLAECLNEALLPSETQSGSVYLCGNVKKAGGYNREICVEMQEYEHIPEDERAVYLYQVFCEAFEENSSPVRLEEIKKEAELAQEPDITTSETVEGSYKRLYDEVYSKQGYDYNGYYNAKGNFYAVLGSGREERTTADGMTVDMNYEQTVVYDRVSQNGKCHLFVQYKTYYDADGNETATAIEDMYAVNRETGEVLASGRHAWEDVGDTAYREATGE